MHVCSLAVLSILSGAAVAQDTAQVMQMQQQQVLQQQITQQQLDLVNQQLLNQDISAGLAGYKLGVRTLS